MLQSSKQGGVQAALFSSRLSKLEGFRYIQYFRHLYSPGLPKQLLLAREEPLRRHRCRSGEQPLACGEQWLDYSTSTRCRSLRRGRTTERTLAKQSPI